jgi:copper chaperone
MSKVQLKIDGMSCGHCVAAVENSLKAISGVKSVMVDLDSGSAIVEGTVDIQVLISAVEQEGYEARVVD